MLQDFDAIEGHIGTKKKFRIAALVRCGVICGVCNAKECRDKSGIEIECVECGGVGCNECRNGHVELSGCPKEIAGEIVPALSFIDRLEKGMPPVAGGTLDQSAWFINAADYFGSEVSRVKAELIK